MRVRSSSLLPSGSRQNLRRGDEERTKKRKTGDQKICLKALVCYVHAQPGKWGVFSRVGGCY